MLIIPKVLHTGCLKGQAKSYKDKATKHAIEGESASELANRDQLQLVAVMNAVRQINATERQNVEVDIKMIAFFKSFVYFQNCMLEQRACMQWGLPENAKDKGANQS